MEYSYTCTDHGLHVCLEQYNTTHLYYSLVHALHSQSPDYCTLVVLAILLQYDPAMCLSTYMHAYGLGT